MNLYTHVTSSNFSLIIIFFIVLIIVFSKDYKFHILYGFEHLHSFKEIRFMINYYLFQMAFKIM